MPPTTKTMPTVPLDVDATVERIRDLNEKIVGSAKSAGAAYLDAYERVLQNLVDFEQKAAEATQLEWVTTLASAHANFVKDLSAIYTTAARDLLK